MFVTITWEVCMKPTKVAISEQPEQKREVSQVPQEVYDPKHPYKDWDPSAPALSDEDYRKLLRGELVEL
jgi:hypothetical protein